MKPENILQLDPKTDHDQIEELMQQGKIPDIRYSEDKKKKRGRAFDKYAFRIIKGEVGLSHEFNQEELQERLEELQNKKFPKRRWSDGSRHQEMYINKHKKNTINWLIEVQKE